MKSKKADLVAVIGRRRVGKTYLIRQTYSKDICFEFIGTQFANRENQLKKFATIISKYNKNNLTIATPKDWAEAFQQLSIFLEKTSKSKRQVLFFDEFPWMNSHRSGFLEEFAYWWNSWASKQNIVVVICGSATSWMIEKVINNKGGLHNRVTEKITLEPFTLAETKEFIHQINPKLNEYQILQLYMSIGGIPHYLEQIRQGESATESINRLCFEKEGFLRHEFQNLYAALFDKPERHIEIIRQLSKKRKGFTRQEIIEQTKLNDGGGLTKILTELEASSFIMSINPIKKKRKDILYRLADEYSLFYLKFIDGQRAIKQNVWLARSNSNQYKIWRGYAFENICIKHTQAIVYSLGISGIDSTISSYQANATDELEGVQIDLLIDRADQTINLCEMKFYNDEITLSKDEAAKLRRRRTKFIEHSKTKKTVFLTLVTTFGLTNNIHSGLVDQVITIDDLFQLKAF